MTKQKLLYGSVILLNLFFVYLYYLEYFHYANYVYSVFHINLHRAVLMAVIPLGICSALYLRSIKTKITPVILIVLFCLISAPKGLEAAGLLVSRFHQIILGKDYIFVKINETEYGRDYKFIEFVKKYLQNNRNLTISLPPFRLPWRHTGDLYMMNSLMYPISVLNDSDKSNIVLISSEVDGANYELWPDIKIPASKVIIYDWATDKAVEYPDRDWNPEEWQDKKPWGLIIRKNI